MEDISKNVLDNMKVIGRRKYLYFKTINFNNLSEEELDSFVKTHKMTIGEALKSIDKYEAVHHKPISKETKEYLNSLGKPREKKVITITKEWLYKSFANTYFEQNGVNYSKSTDSVENIKPLIYYFIGDFENFKKCKNVSNLSEPSLSKGLLIIGSFGNGKTSSMDALESALKNTNINFKGYSANEIVKMYERCETPLDKKEFTISTEMGVRSFDDVLTEDIASNYGKLDVFKSILEQRYRKGLRTYITCNYKDNTKNNLKVGLQQFAERYGSRVYDRLFEMFNIIEFKGKSYRK